MIHCHERVEHSGKITPKCFLRFHLSGYDVIWSNGNLAAGSCSSSTKWSVKLTNKSSWQTLHEKREAKKPRKVKSRLCIFYIEYTLTNAY